MDLPKTKDGNKHVLVLQGLLPMVYPMPDQKTVRIAKKEFIAMFGVSEALLSDRGTNLLSFSMKDIYSLLGLKNSTQLLTTHSVMG